MKFRLIALGVILLPVLFQSCSTTKQLNALNADALNYFNQQDYAKAFELYDQSITLGLERSKKIDPAVYQNGGISAWHLGKPQKTIDYLEKTKSLSIADARTHFYLAKAYLEIDNLSREIINLEECLVYQDDEYVVEANGLLFSAYVRSENWAKAKLQWEHLNHDQQKDILYMEGYVKTVQQLNETEPMLRIAKELIKLSPKNTMALEVLGIHYYQLAETSYQQEMKAYEKNKTTKQYKQLLAALEKINTNFKLSRDYLEALYAINPQPVVANYLGNIYTRFQNETKAKYYYARGKKS